MRSARSRGLASALSLTLLAGLVLAVATPGATAAEVSTKSDRIYVLNNNVENLANGYDSCDYTFKRLLNKVRDSDHKYYPDILTFQQVAHEGATPASGNPLKDTASLTALIALLEKEWGVTYDGEVAVKRADNVDMYPKSKKCGQYKGYQTNAVLWRVDRFEKIGQTEWQSDARINKDGTWTGCQNLASNLGSEFKSQLRTKNIAVSLTDTKGTTTTTDDRSLVVASVHWPRQPKTDDELDDKIDAHACTKENMLEADAALERLIGNKRLPADSMKIVAGDMNAKTSDGNWWQWATRNGYVDPIANKCGQTTKEQTAKCLDFENKRHATTQGRTKRIDYILIKDGTTTKGGADTIPQKSAKMYSGHNAVRATAIY